MPRITVDVSDEVNDILEEIGKIAYWSKSTAAAHILGKGIYNALKTAKDRGKILNSGKVISRKSKTNNKSK